jgi:succinate dehydrogenase/fumarate reductase flavoprotein subunit
VPRGSNNPAAVLDSSPVVDVVVLGSGVAGLTAALSAAEAGLSPLVVEHADEVGGTSARSSGTIWIPGNHHLRDHGILDDAARAEAYLSALVGNAGEAAMWKAFLDQGPCMLADLEKRAGLVFRPFMQAPDYRQDIEGAAAGGRALEPPTFDGRLLAQDFDRLSWPLPELMLFGGMMLTRAEAGQLLTAHRSPQALALSARLVARYLADRLRHRRGTRLVLGNALVARLFKALLDRDVPVLTGVESQSLVKRDGRVGAVALRHAGREVAVEASAGVILAGGGYPASPAWRARELPAPVAEHTPAAPGANGSSIELALAAGAVLGPRGSDNAFWFPSSIARRPDGSTAVYPHIVLDRSKPGLIAVGAAGKRFVNEAVSYHEFVRAMYRAPEAQSAIPAFLVCDRAFIRRYGLGLIRPRTPSLRKHVANGYLKQGGTIAELASRAGIRPDALAATVDRYNGFAASGIDAEFSKGKNIYDRSNGDPNVAPNPCIGPIATPPFFALPIVPTPLATSRGLRADTHARVLDEAGAPIPGLYVCGNDMQSVFGGEYPGAGAQLGPAMTFAWIAARHAAGITA